ncbi:LysR substrate-binding domain-containing protein [Variovorax sp. J22P271]|uniref:LysR family transcriptional regulator n=1 Tax=Variovorax davisae TaxID=3053515 RepID=UPI0025749FFA|nr:LysR substrate-binding domain-containing protein [Variovorax sp. J22P271]MDM0032034.1 LysR substrate-binding domain-containing protein [Variovorax sp. J22P271]
MDWTQRIRLRHLQLLISLAETQNVSRSAELLHMTQPALSKWLKDLEADMGVELFERHARGLRPTHYCEVLLEHARRIRVDLDRAREEMALLLAGSTGYVAIGGSGATIASTVPGAVLALLKAMPGARVDIVEGTMDRLMEMLGRRELDVAVGRSHPQYLTPLVESEVLYAEPLHFVARKGHPLHRLKSMDWDDLYRYRWVVFSRDTPARTLLNEELRLAQRSLPADALQSNSVFASFSMLTASDMVTIASQRSIAQYERMGALQRLPMRFSSAPPVMMYWRNDTSRSTAVAQALQCLRDLEAP